MSDDHTAQAWSVYQSILQPYVQTPNIERLAREGCILQNAYATNSLCGPSRAAILTGQYSHRNNVYTNRDSLDPDTRHLAHNLQDAGYQTAIIGKWHLKARPSGFDDYSVLPGQGHYANPILRNENDWVSGGKAYPGHSTDVITSLSLEWLKNWTGKKPFFLMCHFKATHEPYGFPERYANLYESTTFPIPPTFHESSPENSTRTFRGQTIDILAGRFNENPERYGLESFPIEGLNDREIREKTYQQLVRNFLRSARAVDDNIGRILEFLENHELLENTVVIYTSDQGYFLGEHGMFDKRMMFEESIRMPFVIRYPREVSRGYRNHDFILNIDFAPLILDYAGVPAPASMQGRSFRKNLAGQTPEDWRSSFYYRYWTHQSHRPAHFGLRTDRYKLIYYYGLPLGMNGAQESPVTPSWELYDLQNDPLESRNLYQNSEYDSVVEDLIEQLLELRRQLQDLDRDSPEVLRRFNDHEDTVH